MEDKTIFELPPLQCNHFPFSSHAFHDVIELVFIVCGKADR